MTAPTAWFCRTFHRRITRPVNGHYTCLSCMRTFPVKWSGEDRQYAGQRIQIAPMEVE